MRKYIFCTFSMLLLAMTVCAQKHTDFVGLSLELGREEMMQNLIDKGLHSDDSIHLSGHIAGLDVQVTFDCKKDSNSINHILVSTIHQQGQTINDDYKAMLHWLEKRYGKPNWESTVRSHRFARWYVDYDRDIILIATAQPAVEVWFYDNHVNRNIDYYSILKYCERNPVSTVPFMTAKEQVTWKSKPDSTAGKKTLRKGKKTIWRSKRTTPRSRKATKSRKRSR